MPQAKSSPSLAIDLKIRVNGSVFNFSLGSALKWIVPVAVAVIRLVITHLHKGGGP